jgi:hypothetical protein
MGAERGFFASLLSAPDPVQFFLSKAPLPPEPEPYGHGTYQGTKFSQVDEDLHRVERRQLRVAILLKKVEKDPTWRPAKEEIAATNQCVGIRNHS